MSVSIAAIAPIATPQTIAAPGSAGQSGQFQNILSSAISSIEGASSDASSAVQKFLSGENEELHTTILATQKAQLAFELGLQVRNKVVDAYQEVMKMAI